MNLQEICKSRKYQVLLEYVWRRRGMATRTEMVRDLHLSNTTVFPAVDRLLRAGLLESAVLPDERKERKGRKPGGVKLRGAQGFAVGISIWDSTDICVLDVAQNVVARKKICGLPRESKAGLRRLCGAVNELLRKYRLDRARMIGMGIVLPGLVDHQTGVVRKSSRLVSAGDIGVGEYFTKKYNCRCRVLSTAPVLALTEKEWGGAGDMSNFLYCSGNGVGMFLGGRLFTGEQGYAGEIGFMKFDDGREPTLDTRSGTFGRARPFWRIGPRLETLIKGGATTVAADWLRAGRAPTLELVVEGAVQGDPLCRELIAEGFRVDAEMLVGLAYLFNPAAIFLLPWTGNCPDVSLDIVRRRLVLCRIVNPDMRIEVLAAQCGRDELARGIAMLPLNDFFGMPSLL